MEIVEIFASISGEVGTTIKQGELCTFIRFYGCPVGCVYCDTPESWSPAFSYLDMSIDEILLEVRKLGNSKIVITGGEPIIQKDFQLFLDVLTGMDMIDAVTIETSGIYPKHIEIHPKNYLQEKVNFAVDYKLPSSESKYALLNKFPYEKLQSEDLIKFLIFRKIDLSMAIAKCKELMSLGLDELPVFVFTVGPDIKAQLVYDQIKLHSIPAVFNVQIHKILGFA